MISACTRGFCWATQNVNLGQSNVCKMNEQKWNDRDLLFLASPAQCEHEFNARDLVCVFVNVTNERNERNTQWTQFSLKFFRCWWRDVKQSQMDATQRHKHQMKSSELKWWFNVLLIYRRDFFMEKKNWEQKMRTKNYSVKWDESRPGKSSWENLRANEKRQSIEQFK